ncbi:MAG: hypothetical protein GTO12_01500, partial [Proteobacteria bacterium]|nr:hypothetical protein [Pseudomonadota bacterium]
MNIVRAIRVMKTESISIVHTDADFQREVLEGKQPVFVEFSAAWCGLCHIIAPLIEEMAMRFRTRVKFCKIDMDD